MPPQGDVVDGETSDAATAGVLLQALTHPHAENREFCAVNSQGAPPRSPAEWEAVFDGLKTRERQMRSQGLIP
ncbi:MAG: hypothetical protein ACPIOQ_81930 [Promethearchaeia archaeon]